MGTIGAADSRFWVRMILIYVRRDTACRVRRFQQRKPVENVPPERFQNIGTANGTQGGAVLFAPPSKSCRFSHPPAPCAKSMAQGISLSADSDSGGSSPPKNLSPAALSWSSLTGSTTPSPFASARCFLLWRTQRNLFLQKQKWTPLTNVRNIHVIFDGKQALRTALPAGRSPDAPTRRGTPDG